MEPSAVWVWEWKGWLEGYKKVGYGKVLAAALEREKAHTGFFPSPPTLVYIQFLKSISEDEEGDRGGRNSAIPRKKLAGICEDPTFSYTSLQFPLFLPLFDVFPPLGRAESQG